VHLGWLGFNLNRPGFFSLFRCVYLFCVSCHIFKPILSCASSYTQPAMSIISGLEDLVDETISVITNDGRNIVGILKGYDQATNLIMDESHERVYSTRTGVEQLVLGLYIIRGDNISVVGELDEDLDSNLDLSQLRAQPLKPVMH